MTFKRTCKAMLKEENYIDALAYFCGKLMDASAKGQDLEDVYEDIDEKLWNMACNTKIEDATGNALRILSALRVAVDSETV